MGTARRAEVARPDTVWEVVADLDHNYREEIGRDGKSYSVHSYQCRRCRLELLPRQATNYLGTPPN
jgi:hypothetical protein